MDNNSLNLFGIFADKVDSDMFDFAEKSAYISWPIVAVAKNNEKPYVEKTEKPIELFKKGTQYSLLRGLMTNEKDSVLSIPWRAFREIQDIARQKSNKVLADLMAAVIVKESLESVKKDSDSKNVFFIECKDPRKIIGRLGNLYLNHKNIIVVFVTYKAGGLMTDMLTRNNESLYFDIDYFKNHLKEKSDIIPNDYRESLTQTVFINMAQMTQNPNTRMSPIRCEILSQGLSNVEISENVDFVYKILSNTNNLTPPFCTNDNSFERATRIPYVLRNAETIYDVYKTQIRNEVGLYE